MTSVALLVLLVTKGKEVLQGHVKLTDSGPVLQQVAKVRRIIVVRLRKFKRFMQPAV